VDRVVLDTDVSSLSLKRRLPSPVMTRLIGKQPCISALTYGLLLATLNVKDFEDFAEHEGLTLITE
jgi:hypothetical protein